MKDINLNTVVKLEHFQNVELMECMLLQNFPYDPFSSPTKKAWEWGMGEYALKKLDLLKGLEGSTAIGIGSGLELFQFWITNFYDNVCGTDLFKEEFHQHDTYGNTVFGNYIHKMLTNPSECMWNPGMPWRPNSLKILKQSGTNLIDFGENSADLIFCFSSIEHFEPVRKIGAKHEGAIRCMEECSRVLKPKGIMILSTEYMPFGNSHHEFFNKNNIIDELVNSTTLKPISEIDFEIDEEFKNKENWQYSQAKINPKLGDLVRFPESTYTDSNVPYSSIFLTLKNDK